MIYPFLSDDLFYHIFVQIGYIFVNIFAKLGDEILLVEHGHVDLEVFLILRYVSQRAVKVLMKGHLLGHEAINVAMDHTLIEEAGRIRLSHKFEEPSDDIGVRRLLGKDVVYSWFNNWDCQWDIHKDLILSLYKVKFLEEGALGIFISQNKVNQGHTI